MANQRQRKKDTKNQQLKTVSKVLGITYKEAKKLPTNTLKNIVTQTEKREKARNQYQARKQAKEAYIKENNLKGVSATGSTWDQLYKAKAEQEAAAKAADKAAKAAAKRQRTKERNQKMLEDAGIPLTRYPKKWYEMGEAKLSEWIEKESDDDKIIDSGDVWIYIGYGNRGGGHVDTSGFTSRGYYGLRDNDTLRDDIAESPWGDDVGGSPGKAGDIHIKYGSHDEVESEMETYEFLGYQTIFFGNQMTEHAFLTYTAAAIDNSPVDTWSFTVKQMNGFLNQAARETGQSELKKMMIETKWTK